MKPAYTYKADVTRIIDGDTYEMLVDLGFGVHAKQTIRLEGVDTPELNSKDSFEKAFALYVTECVHDFMFLEGFKVVIKTKYDKTFARYVASVSANGVDLAEWIRKNKYTKADVPR